MDELGAIAGAVEDTATADGRTFDDGEHQAGFEHEGTMDTDRDDAAAAIVTFVQRKAGRQDDVAGAALILLADQPAAAVVGPPRGQLLRWRSGGRGRPSDHARTVPIGARNARCADMLISVILRGANKAAAGGDHRRRTFIRKGNEGRGYSAAIP